MIALSFCGFAIALLSQVNYYLTTLILMDKIQLNLVYFLFYFLLSIVLGGCGSRRSDSSQH